MKLILCLLALYLTVAMGQHYFGVNEAALGWGGSVLPGKVGTNYHLISNASLDYFAAKGMNTIRVSILWERLQPTLFGAFDPTYVQYLTDSVNYITKAKGMYCLVDLHNYHRYRGNVIGSAAVPYSALTDVWQKLASLYKTNPLMIWGTMNEPHAVGYLAAQLGANAAIKGVRDAGATQLITISGNDFSAVYSWVGTNSEWMGPANITDPLNNWMYEMHQYFDNVGGQTVCLPNWNVDYYFSPVTTWARNNGVKIFLGEFGINDSDECLPLLHRLMTFLRANADVWDGWTWWAAGPGWAPDYVYLIEPMADGSDRNRLMATLKNYFPSPSPSPSTSRVPASPSPTTSRVPASPSPSKSRAPASPSTSRAPASPSTSRAPASPSPSKSRAPASPSTSRAPASPSSTPAVPASGPQYFGVNQPGLAWGSSVLPGKAGTNFPLVSTASIDYFAAKGMNTVRVSILWERIQPELYGQLDATYSGYLRNTVNYITNTKGMNCLIDLHNFHRYNGQLVGSREVPTYTLSNVWHQIARMFLNNQRVIFGAMNQPHGVSYQDALRGANAAITGIRSIGATQLITISGSDFSAVNSWVGTNSEWMGPANITDPLNNWMYEMHQFFDGQGGQTVCQPNTNVEALFGKVTQWARSLGVKVFLGSFGINDSDQCLPLLNRVMTYIKANSDVWNGWAWWAAGPWWPQNYVYLIEPKADGTDRNRLMATLQNYFP